MEIKKTKSKKKKFIAVILIVVVVIIAIIYYATVLMGNAKNKEDDVLLREYPVSRGDITAGTDGTGALVLDGVPQSYDAPVKLEEIYVKPGDSVVSGDKIALASQKDLEENLHDLKVELSKAKIALENAANAKAAGALDAGMGGEVSEIKAEYDTQKSQARAEANEISANISTLEKSVSEIDAQIAEIDNLLASLPVEEDRTSLEESKSILLEEKSVKELELAGERKRLNTANSAIDQIESTENQRLDDVAKQNEINKQKQSLEVNGLTNGINLAQIDVDEINRKIGQTEQLLNDLVLTADCDGLVVEVNYTAGSETAEKPVISIGDAKGINALLQVSQSDIVDIQEGQEVELRFDAFPERTFAGKVSKKSSIPVKDSNPVMYQINASINLEDAELLPGMTCNAQFILKQAKDVLMLSNKAVKAVDGKQVVLLKDEKDELYEQIIETGFSDGKFSEVLSGLNEGQTVYVEG